MKPTNEDLITIKINDIEMGHQHKTYPTQNNNLLSDDLDDENFDDAHD